MTADKEIKPAEIQDDDLDGAQGGLRTMQTTGIRTTSLRPINTRLRPVGNTADFNFSKDELADYDESGPGIVHKTR